MTCFVCDRQPVARFRTEWPTTEVSGLIVHKACTRELETAFEFWDKVTDQSATELTWASNGHHPFDDLLAIWERLGYISAEQRAATTAAREVATEKFLAAYRANPPKRSAEELAEMRAAFGEGETVVDIITGERIEL